MSGHRDVKGLKRALAGGPRSFSGKSEPYGPTSRNSPPIHNRSHVEGVNRAIEPQKIDCRWLCVCSLTQSGSRRTCSGDCHVDARRVR